jgi:hypothetical protein
MAKQTINIGAAPNDGTGTPLRTSFDYCNLNFTELYTATGPSGNNIVVPGTATITGDLTVATTALKVVSASNRVLINQASAIQGDSLEVTAKSDGGAISLFGRASDNGATLSFRANGTATAKASLTANDSGLAIRTGTVERYNIDTTGVSTWYVGGSTAMTLNSTGLGVGVASPAQKLDIAGNIQMTGVSGGTRYLLINADNSYTGSFTIQAGQGSPSFGAATVLYGNSHATYPGGVWIGRSSGSTGPIMFGTGGITPTTVQMTLDASGNLLVGPTSGTYHTFRKNLAVDAGNVVFEIQGNGGATSSIYYSVSGYNANAANAASKFGRDATTLRSINAGGTVNASGADYAEYMVKCSDFILSKGDVAGIDANGKLTNVFADAVSFVVKSTDPSYVGNDKWGVDLEGDALEAARQLVDRIAFAGQVPVNVTGAKAGDYIVPVVNGTGIKGQAVSNPTFEQYQLAVGKVISIDADGRARIIVKVA